MNRKKVVLGALIAILLLALLYAYFGSPQQQRVTSSERSASEVVAGKRVQADDRRMVKIELLEREGGKFKGIKRDLFGSLFPRPVEKKSPPPVVTPPPPPPPVVKPKPPVAPVEIVRRDLARFTFMGYLRKQERWTIFLSANSEIFLVQEGDKFGRNDQFHALKITPEQLVIEQATQGRIVIPLVEKKPLVPSAIPSASSRPTTGYSPQPPVINPAKPPEATGSIGRPLRSNSFGAARGGITSLPATPPSPPSPVMTPDNEVPNDQ